MTVPLFSNLSETDSEVFQSLRSCFEMIKKLFEVKFLHLLPESSGQIGTAIFPKSPVEPEVFSSKTFKK